MKVMFAEKCAWRAIYFYIGQRQVFHVGIDPSYSYGPNLFGGLELSWLTYYKRWRIIIPHIRWRSGMNRFKLAIYRRQQWFWHKIDGRYGWGSGRS
jgi:hypothetical protein